MRHLGIYRKTLKKYYILGDKMIDAFLNIILILLSFMALLCSLALYDLVLFGFSLPNNKNM